MEAFTFLLLSIFLITLYGFIYVAHRLRKENSLEERIQFKRSFFIFSIILILTGSSIALLVYLS